MYINFLLSWILNMAVSSAPWSANDFMSATKGRALGEIHG